jgi:hypothetical protein
MAAMASVATVAALNPIEYAFMSINTNPYFIGLMMLLLNLGGRFIGMEVSKEQEKFFQQPWVRRALIFTVLFVATRNVFVAFIMTIIVLLVISFLFNENSDLYLLPKEKDSTPQLPQGGFTPEEMEIYRRLSDKQARLAVSQKSETDLNKDTKPAPSLEETYAYNMSKLQSNV